MTKRFYVVLPCNGLMALAEWGKYSEVLANGNWDKLFALLPENLSDAPISQREEDLLTFFQEIAGGISTDFEYFNAFLQRLVVYLFNPITKHEVNVYQVCHSLDMCFQSLDSYNPIELDYEAILERLLQLAKEESISKKEIGVSVFMAMSMLFATERLDDFEYLKIRKQVLGEFVAIIDAGWLPQRVLVELLGPGMLFPGKNEALVEILFDCETFMKVLLVRMTKKVNIELSITFLGCCCKVCPKRGVEFFMKNNIMMQSVILLLRSIQNENPEYMEALDNILEALEQLLMQAESLVDGNETLYNPIALQIEGKRGLKILKEIENGEGPGAVFAKRINSSYFGEGWENYLARRRGLKIKRAE